MSTTTKLSRPRNFLSDPRSTGRPAPPRPISTPGAGISGLRDPKSTR